MIRRNRVSPIDTDEDLTDGTGRRVGTVRRNGDVETHGDPGDCADRIVIRKRRGKRVVAAVIARVQDARGHWYWARSSPQRDRG